MGGCLSHGCLHHLGTWPATQACAMTGNRTREPSQPTLHPLSHSSQGGLQLLNGVWNSWDCCGEESNSVHFKFQKLP